MLTWKARAHYLLEVEDLVSELLRLLTEMRRIWNNATQVLSDKEVDTTRGEAAARSRW